MKKFLLSTVALVFVLTLVISPTRVIAQGTDPEAVIRAIIQALNDGDVEGAMELVAEDAVIVLVPPPADTGGVFVGKDEIRERYEALVANKEYLELSDFEVFGNEATWSATLVADEWQAIGLAPLNATGYGIVQDGLLQTYTWYIAEESLAQLTAVGVVEARAAATNAGDVDAAAAFFAEDAVYHLVPPPPGAQGTYSGQDEIRGRLAELAAINGEMELDIRQVDADKVISLTKFSADALHSLGLPFIEGFEEYTIQDGMITAYTWTMTEGSLAWEQAAVARATNLEANKMLATRYFEELWNQGDLAVADATLSEDFVSHNFPAGDREALKQAVVGFREENPGAYFTLDDMVVTEDRAFIQNTMMTRPEDASESVEGEPGPPMLLVLGFEDAKITDRWLWLSPE